MARRAEQEFQHVSSFTATELGAVGMSSTFYRKAGKRLLDLALAIPLLLIAFPAVLLLAGAVVVTSGWPAFYSSKRMGRNGHFKMWKLRTMVRNADELLAQWKASDPEFARKFEEEYKLQDDPRITRLGRFLRETSLDELPQLWNVVIGNMSLVGPRPITDEELSHYGSSRSELLSVRPGVTGLWQVSGRGEITYPERTQVELSYCRDVSLSGDIGILWRTLAAPIRRDGA